VTLQTFMTGFCHLAYWVDAIRKIRMQNPTLGKANIAERLKKNNIQISANSVGRM
jgi:hypothetical protein